ncbi:MAG: hypothetical protein IJO75_01320 [Clostridia bacterium]|nr:hypothetical protein [Clostridia bacterium]
MKQRVLITNPEDRQQVAAILVKNGYTVRLAKDKVSAKKTVTYVELWRSTDDYSCVGCRHYHNGDGDDTVCPGCCRNYEEDCYES